MITLHHTEVRVASWLMRATVITEKMFHTAVPLSIYATCAEVKGHECQARSVNQLNAQVQLCPRRLQPVISVLCLSQKSSQPSDLICVANTERLHGQV